MTTTFPGIGATAGPGEPGDPGGKGRDRDRAVPRRETGVLIEERTRTKQPPMFRVLLHNDDYTTKEFVVMILEVVFHLGEQDATQVMLHVHNNGVGVAGVYPHEIAETKVARVLQLAKKFEFPLQCSIEPD